MQLKHEVSRASVRFDDGSLVGFAGLVPLLALLGRVGLARRVDARMSRVANAGSKVVAVVAGMAAGADSIDDLDLLRHGGSARLFARVPAPSTIGTFLRGVSLGGTEQLRAVTRQVTAALVAAAPGLLPGIGRAAVIDVDDTLVATYGQHKQGAGFGHTRRRGINVLLATLSTAGGAPVLVGDRLRSGTANSARGAGQFVAAVIRAARAAGATGDLLARFDSGFFTHAVVTACRDAGVRFSVTARHNPAVLRAIASIDENAWTPIEYPAAVWDPDANRWVSDAEVAEIKFTAFTATRHRKSGQVTARLVVRRVRRLHPTDDAGTQGELFTTWRYHAVFTDSTAPLLDAERAHRRHAIVEQTIADLKQGALAHLPSGKFTANTAWLTLACLAHNLLRAAGALAGGEHTTARTATTRARLVNVPARIVRTARRVTLRLPARWRWADGFTALHTAALDTT